MTKDLRRIASSIHKEQCGSRSDSDCDAPNCVVKKGGIMAKTRRRFWVCFPKDSKVPDSIQSVDVIYLTRRQIERKNQSKEESKDGR